MDEVLKKRLIGAAVLVLAALLISLLLPRPGQAPELEPGQQSVTIDLNAPPPATDAERPPPDLTTVAPLDAAPAEAAETPEATSPPGELAPASAETPPPQAAEPAKPAVPALKLDSRLSTPPTKPEPVKAEAPKPAEKPETARPEPVKPVPAPVTPPPARPATAAKPDKAEKPWYVQIGSFSDIGNARQVLDKLKSAGYAGLISPTETRSGTLYRARVGPYAGRAAAETAREKLGGQGIKGAALVQE